MISFNQNLFSYRQIFGENCHLFILFEKTGKITSTLYSDFVKDRGISLIILPVCLIKLRENLINILLEICA